MTDYDHNPPSGIAATAHSVINGTHTQVQKTMNDLRGHAKREDDSSEPLTHFHSFFYDLFTWRYPRSTASIFASAVAAILTFHYVNVLRYAFKAGYLLFATAAILESIAKPLGAQGFVSQMRPKRYYTIPRESLETFFAEIHDFFNFVVVEFQRIVFVENIFTTLMAFIVTFLGYFLVKYLPFWGLLLLSTTAAFSGPLIYLNYQDAIDEQINHLEKLVNDKLTQAKHASEKYAGDATAHLRATTNQLTDKLANITAPRRSKTPEPRREEKLNGQAHNAPVPMPNPDDYRLESNSFPQAPTHEPVPVIPGGEFEGRTPISAQ